MGNGEAGQDLVGARINHDNRAVGQQGDLVTAWQEGAVGDAGRRRADLLKLVDALTVRFGWRRVHRGFLALRHNEQPTRVIDEQRLGVVRSIRIAEAVRMIRHSQTIGPRVLEREDSNEAASPVAISNVSDVRSRSRSP
jgi:hypothetical protein